MDAKTAAECTCEPYLRESCEICRGDISRECVAETQELRQERAPKCCIGENGLHTWQCATLNKPDQASAGVREWCAREVYAKWARKEHHEMPARFVDVEAYERVKAERDGQIVELEMLRRPLKSCGHSEELGNTGAGCGEKFIWSGDVYRCLDCGVLFHKRCLKKHCEHEWDHLRKERDELKVSYDKMSKAAWETGAQLRAELAEAKEFAARETQRKIKAWDDRDATLAEVARLREALDFYATMDECDDDGALARKTLERK